MMKLLDTTFGFGSFLRNADGGAGGGGGAAAGGAAAGGAAAGGAAAGGAAAGAAADGAAAGGAASAGHPDAGGNWWGKADYGFDDATRQFFAGKNYPDEKTALASLPLADKMARDRNVIAKPDPAKLGEWEGWQALGWKESAEDYAKEFKKPDNAGPINDLIFDQAIKAGHKHKAPPAVVQSIYAEVTAAMNQMQADAETQAAGEIKKLDTALRGEWGADYDRKREIAKRGMEYAGIGAEDAKALDEAMGSPAMVKHFAEFGELLGEDRLVRNDTGGGQLPASIDGLRAELNRLQGDTDFMAKFKDARHPQHKEAVAQRQRIIDKIAAAEARRSQAA